MLQLPAKMAVLLSLIILSQSFCNKTQSFSGERRVCKYNYGYTDTACTDFSFTNCQYFSCKYKSKYGCAQYDPKITLLSWDQCMATCCDSSRSYPVTQSSISQCQKVDLDSRIQLILIIVFSVVGGVVLIVLVIICIIFQWHKKMHECFRKCIKKQQEQAIADQYPNNINTIQIHIKNNNENKVSEEATNAQLHYQKQYERYMIENKTFPGSQP